MDILIKLGIGAILAGFVGWERELHGRPAGVRTHMLVATGVILLCEVSKAFPGQDQSRIAAQVVTGIGFLGAGTIFRMGGEVRGLTSAASVWAIAGVSMAVSVGGPFIIVACVGTVLMLFTLNVLERVEVKIAPGLKARELTVRLNSRSGLVPLLDAFQNNGGKVLGMRVEEHAHYVEVDLTVSGDPEKLLCLAVDTPGVQTARWNR